MAQSIHSSSPLTLDRRTIEFQFAFYYDLGVRILPLPNGKPDKDSEASIVSLRQSDLTRYFHDHFPERLLVAHLHLSASTIDYGGKMAGRYAWTQRPSDDHNVEPCFRLADDDVFLSFALPTQPPELGASLPSYAPIECSVFHNGFVVLLIRCVNLDPLTAAKCVEMIKHPELLSAPSPPYKPGILAQAADDMANSLESRLATVLNDRLQLRGIWMKDGEVRHVTVLAAAPQHAPKVALMESGLGCLLERSRPYVGTIVNASNKWGSHEHELKILAVASARTTPQFLNQFSGNVDDYLRQDGRNLYHPGPGVVMIGRRGWACVMSGSQAPEAFRLGVIEATFFAIEALGCSARAARRYLEDVLREGQRLGRDLNLEVGRLKGRDILRNYIVNWVRRAFDRKRRKEELTLSGRIYEFAAFLGRARLNSPCEDASTLLGAYITTHTGIAAVDRIKRLTHHDHLLDSARQTMASYGAFLHTASEYWQVVNVQVSRLVLVASVATVLLTLWVAWA